MMQAFEPDTISQCMCNGGEHSDLESTQMHLKLPMSTLCQWCCHDSCTWYYTRVSNYHDTTCSFNIQFDQNPLFYQHKSHGHKGMGYCLIKSHGHKGMGYCSINSGQCHQCGAQTNLSINFNGSWNSNSCRQFLKILEEQWLSWKNCTTVKQIWPWGRL